MDTERTVAPGRRVPYELVDVKLTPTSASTGQEGLAYRRLMRGEFQCSPGAWWRQAAVPSVLADLAGTKGDTSLEEAS